MTPDALKWWLTLASYVLEVLGIVVILVPEVIPGISRLANTLADAIDRFAGIVHNLILTPGAGSLTLSSQRPRLMDTIEDATPFPKKIDILLEEIPKLYEAIDVVEDRLDDLDKAISERFETGRQEVEQWTHEVIKTAIERFRNLRILSAVLLLSGLACQAVVYFLIQ